jgi:LAO/AO transport system kinase
MKMGSSSSKNWTVEDFVARILQGDRVALGRAITLVESTRPEHRQKAEAILDKCLPHAGNSFRIGITGPPGVGKSSFIEAFGTKLVLEQGKRLAVLAIDPTSQVTHGSILGDKTRMERLSTEPNAFIRPSPAGKTLGGVANCTQEAMLLCEAAGFNTIFIETVGVGQSETAVAGMVDFFLLLLLPGAGDELQGIKRGIVELADLIAINKADGEQKELAKVARQDYAQALHLFPAKENSWQPKAVTCSTLTGEGLEGIWQVILDYQSNVKDSGWFERNRLAQMSMWFRAQFEQQLKQILFSSNDYLNKFVELETAFLKGKISMPKAIGQLLESLGSGK